MKSHHEVTDASLGASTRAAGGPNKTSAMFLISSRVSRAKLTLLSRPYTALVQASIWALKSCLRGSSVVDNGYPTAPNNSLRTALVRGTLKSGGGGTGKTYPTSSLMASLAHLCSSFSCSAYVRLPHPGRYVRWASARTNYCSYRSPNVRGPGTGAPPP